MSSIINEGIRAILNPFIFFYKKILHTQKSIKSIKSTKKHKEHKKYKNVKQVIFFLLDVFT